MTVRIDLNRCDGCGNRSEGFCEEICPGDLLYRTQGTVRLREPADCWDCFACVKACPHEALCIELPFRISASGHRLSARYDAGYIIWKMHDTRGILINQCRIPNHVQPGATNKEDAQ